jgi:hypothetical protein
MEIKLIKQEGSELTYEVKLKLEGDMLNMEEQIQGLVNQIGQRATASALKQCDTDGRAIEVQGERYTSKGAQKKTIKRRMDKSK